MSELVFFLYTQQKENQFKTRNLKSIIYCFLFILNTMSLQDINDNYSPQICELP